MAKWFFKTLANSQGYLVVLLYILDSALSTVQNSAESSASRDRKYVQYCQGLKLLIRSMYNMITILYCSIFNHRRRIKTEERGKGRRCVGGEGGDEFIKFLATLFVLPRTILNNKMNCTRMI